MNVKIKIIILFSFIFSVGYSQKDSLFPLGRNASLFKQSSSNLSQAASKISSSQSINSSPLTLPFFDDFSTGGIYPDNKKWIDSTTFRNDGFPRAPFTIGVITFDGLNKHGYPYNKFAASNSSSPADTLTSRPIDTFTGATNGPADSLFISFFYQSCGWGDVPETSDSLILEYYAKDSAQWYHAWGKAGYNLGVYDSSWRFVLLPITNPAFFKDTFQFRFRNYATVSGGFDNWHLDYVYLAKGRSKKDSLFKDMAFGYEAPSLLKDYSAMPWWQFDNATSWAANHPVFIRNNDTSANATNFTVDMKIVNEFSGVTAQAFNGGAFNVPNFAVGSWDNFAPHCNPALNLIPSGTVLGQPTIFYAEHTITYTGDIHHENDTLKHYQDFINYYAFDDGTAESAVGFPNFFAAEMCVKIKTNVPDTLIALDIYWAPRGGVPVISNSTYRTRIWGDAGGIPQTSGFLWQDSLKYPWFPISDSVDTFTHDSLTGGGFPMAAGAIYYIGIAQTSNQALWVGFDRNNNHQDKMFYNVTGSWANSTFPGSYMIRPVMRTWDPYKPFSGIKSQVKSEYAVNVFPNPAKTHFTVNHSGVKEGQLVKAELYDFSGRLVLSEMIINNQQLDVSSIADGVYFLKLSDGKSFDHTSKLFIAH